MGRFVSPLLFLACGGFIWWHNASYSDRVLLIPGLDMVMPELAGDPGRQGELSAMIFGAVGFVLLLIAIWRHFTAREATY